MKLQISYDFTDINKALDVAQKTAEFADIIEVGSLLIYKNGISAVEQFRKAFPDKQLLVDIKLVDRIDKSIPLFCNAGIDYITVLAGTSNNIIQNATKLSSESNTKVMLDLLDSESMGQMVQDAQTLGVDAILYHKGHDAPETALDIFNGWEAVRGNTDLPLFVSGRINEETIDSIVSLKPEGIVIGTAITEADDPAERAAFFKSKIG